MKKALILIGAMLILSGVFAQGMKQGHVVVRQDPRLDSLLVKYDILRGQVMQIEDNKGIPGYRIQIFFDSGINSGERARKEKEAFELRYPHIPGYVTWKAPNYRVRVGDFRSRLEAEKALRDISGDYPNAWVIKDEINFPPIFLNLE